MVAEYTFTLPSHFITSDILGGLKAFREEHPDCRCIVVSMDERQRLLQDFEIIPANDFLRMLWNDEIVNPEML